jgi:hypothetical protein
LKDFCKEIIRSEDLYKETLLMEGLLVGKFIDGRIFVRIEDFCKETLLTEELL